MNNNTLQKIVFWAIAFPIVLLLGFIFPGVMHIVFAAAAVHIYKETFHE